MALPRGTDGGFQRARSIEGTGLQAGVPKILDFVFRVFDDATEALVSVGHVVAAIQIIVDVDFPIAIQRVDAAVEIMEVFREFERRDKFRHLTEKFLKWPCGSVEIHEDKLLP